MSNRILIFLTAVILLAMGAVFVVNIIPNLHLQQAAERLKFNDIEGAAVLQHHKEYTLNFEQQNQLLSFLNHSEGIGKEVPIDVEPAAFEKIILYLFDRTPMELTPVGYHKEELIFIAPEWIPLGYWKDTSNGALKKLINKTDDL